MAFYAIHPRTAWIGAGLFAAGFIVDTAWTTCYSIPGPGNVCFKLGGFLGNVAMFVGLVLMIIGIRWRRGPPA